MVTASNWRVQIIEDERIDREIYKRCFENSPSCQYEFAEAASANDGIELSRAWSPDCILLDFNLPDMNGLDVLDRLRNGHGGLPCAVVMLTSFGGEELAVQAMKGGAMDYLPKGRVDADSLPHIVLNAIQRFRLQKRIEEQRAELERNAHRWRALLETIPQMVWMTDAAGNIEYANQNWIRYTGMHAGSQVLAWRGLVHPEDLEQTEKRWEESRRTGQIFEVEHRLRRAADGCYLWHLVRAVPLRDAAGQIGNWFGSCTDIEAQRQAEIANLQNQKLQSIGQLAAGIAHDFNNLLVSILGGASYALEKITPAHPAEEVLQDVVRAGERAAELTSKLLAYAGKGYLSSEQADLGRLVFETCGSLRSSIPQNIRLEVANAPDLPLVTTDPRQLSRVVEMLVRNSVEAIADAEEGLIAVATRVLAQGAEPRAELQKVACVEIEVRDNGCGMTPETLKRIFDPFYSTKFVGRGLSLAAAHGFVRRAGGIIHVSSEPGKGTSFRVVLPAESAVAVSQS